MKEKQGYGYIYKTTNIINNKIYIGQHKHNKYDNQYLGSGIILLQAIDKYGIENFKKEIIEECYSLKELNEKEIYWIAFYNSTDHNIGYNIETGGNPGPVLEETKRKISKTHLLLNKTRDHSIFIANLSEEARKQISIKNKGRKRIYKNNSIKYVKPEELENFLNQGWKLGFPLKTIENFKKANKTKSIGKKHIHKGNFQKFVKKEDLDKYLKEGWSLGYSKISKRKISKNQNKRSRLNENSNI